MPLIDIDQLSVTYQQGRRTVQAVRNVSFAVEPRESFGLVGESGSGKSTILRAICGLASITAGLRERRVVHRHPAWQRAGAHRAIPARRRGGRRRRGRGRAGAMHPHDGAGAERHGDGGGQAHAQPGIEQGRHGAYIFLRSDWSLAGTVPGTLAPPSPTGAA